MTSDATTRIAAVDIGSNSIRTIVADVSPGGEIRVIDEMKAMPRLGIGVDQSGVLGEGPMRAAIDALQRMATLAEQLKAERVEAVATSAVRDAANGGAFLERVREVTGLRVRLLTGDEEARLSFRSAMAHFEIGAGRTVVADIGGGSLELALAAEGLLDRLVSMPFGAIRVTDQFLSESDTKTPSRAREAVRELRRAVRWAIRDELAIKDWRGARVIGSGGTYTNLAGVVNARAGVQGGGNKSRHGTIVPRSELEHTLAQLTALGPAERRAVPGLNPERADIIVGGLAVAAEVLAVFEGRELLISGYGIREGLLLEAAMVAPAAPADPAETRERSVRAFAERCHYEQPHADQVRRLALRLYDQLAAKLGCEPGRPRGPRGRGAAARRRLPDQLREAPQALVPPGTPRRSTGHHAHGAGRDRERGALPPRGGAEARARKLRSVRPRAPASSTEALRAAARRGRIGPGARGRGPRCIGHHTRWASAPRGHARAGGVVAVGAVGRGAEGGIARAVVRQTCRLRRGHAGPRRLTALAPSPERGEAPTTAVRASPRSSPSWPT